MEQPTVAEPTDPTMEEPTMTGPTTPGGGLHDEDDPSVEAWDAAATSGGLGGASMEPIGMARAVQHKVHPWLLNKRHLQHRQR